MKQTRFAKIFCFLAALLCLFSACNKKNEPTPDKEIPEDPAVTYTYKTEVDESVLCTGGAGEYLLLANKKHPLTKDFAPKELVQYAGATYYDKEIYLESRVAQALLLMTEEMKADGIEDVYVTSGYRSYAYQQRLFAQYLNDEMSGISKEAYEYLGADYIALNYTAKGLSKLNKDDATRVVGSYSAEAGYSEHQTGLCIDFITSSMTSLDRTFEESDAYEWLSENAYRFGFILRYPEEKEEVTGYSYEPWHYRFVGREAATAIYLGSLTLEEFLVS